MTITGIVLRLIGNVLLVGAGLVLAGYVFVGIRDMVAVLRNFGRERAGACSAEDCGFYHSRGPEPHSAACLNPHVSRVAFRSHSSRPRRTGCRVSFRVRGNPAERESAHAYLSEYLELVSAFGGSAAAWRIVLVLAGCGLLAWGVVRFEQILGAFGSAL
jgi:hypothetical protein